ncbi:MAG: flavin reductase family protein [Clostridia bacterium]|nr:flavin reductase family protein [Clostridia bacterium]
MNGYRTLTPEEFDKSPFRLIGKEWMLITAPDEEKKSGANAMTASWGGLGVLWNVPVATVYVRPQRYTHGLMEKADRVSLCFPDERYKKALALCGTKSGRELDKLKESGLSTALIDGVPAVAEANVVMICKKLYADDLKEDNFIDRSHLSHYNGDFHRFYILEIENILVKE